MVRLRGLRLTQSLGDRRVEQRASILGFRAVIGKRAVKLNEIGGHLRDLVALRIMRNTSREISRARTRADIVASRPIATYVFGISAQMILRHNAPKKASRPARPQTRTPMRSN